jgi:N-acetylglucosamine-6-phosphate deacetylase
MSHVLGRHYRHGRPVKVDIAAERIREVREVELSAGEAAQLPWLAPGFIDVQSNGYGGQEFSSPDLTAEKVAEITARQSAFGVTQYCPTVTTASRETFLHALAAIAEACRRWPAVAHAVAGIHVEGPYISPEDGPRGAHPLAHCRPPDWDEFQQFQEAAGGRIRILTMAAEYAGAPAFIARAVKNGVVIAIGHTAANSEQIRAAVDAGASLSTHLGNGAHRVLRRHPNYIWDQLADDRLMASLIVDGHHLPREVVQTFVRAKSPQRCLLVSDLSGLAGLPPGRYDTELCELEILADGRLVIAGQDQLLAGASLPIGVGVANVMAFAGVDLATAVDMATRQPALLLGREVPGLQQSDVADLVLFDLRQDAAGKPELTVRNTVSRGNSVYSLPR